MPNVNFAFSRSECVTVSDFTIPTTTFQGFAPTTTISTSSDVQIYGYMSAGEVLIASLLLMIIALTIFENIAKFISGIVVNRKVMKYEKANVPIDDQD